VPSVDVGLVDVAFVASVVDPGRPPKSSVSFLDRFPVAQIMVPSPRRRTRVDSTLGLLDRLWRMPAIAGGTEGSYRSRLSASTSSK
jgi:hypothetical protein